MNGYPLRANEAELVELIGKITGAGAANPTKNIGLKMTITRVGSGAYRVTFNENMGTWRGARLDSLEDATPANLKGFTVVWEAYVAPTATANGYVEFNVYDSTFTLADFTSTMKMYFACRFARTGTGTRG